MIKLEIFPNQEPISWDNFCTSTPEYSVAIDGYVNTGPRFQNIYDGGPRANFNHHEEVDRLATRATCSQVLMAIRTGFYNAFRKDDEIHCSVFANDNDQDVCTSYFILKHPWLCEKAINPMLNKLVDIEDRLDTTGGAYPFPKDLPILRNLAWVFKPYTDFRLKGGLERGIRKEYISVIDRIEDRINRYLNNKCGSIKLDTRYEVIHRTTNWSMVKEIGAQARTGMLHDGIYAYLSVRERNDGNYNYTVGRMSPFIQFDVAGLLEYFTKFESNPDAKWGGGSTSGINIGGSSRKLGSSITPERLIILTKEHHERQLKKSKSAV